MRKFSVMIGGAAALALGLISANASAAQVLNNPSFELPALGANSEAAGAGTGWQAYNGVYRQNFVGALAHNGSTYVKTFGNGGMFQDIAVTPGQTFSASAWATTSATDSANGAVIGGQLLVIFRNAANTGDVGGAPLVSVIVDQTNPQDVYRQGTLSGTVPAGAGFIRYQLNQYAAAGGAVFFDDASLIVNAVPEPTTLGALGAAGLVLGRRRRA